MEFNKQEWRYDKFYHDTVYVGDKSAYSEEKQAYPTSRLLDGSRDCGYWAEYNGKGYINDIPVIAIYLLDFDQKEIEDECDYDWDTALENGRIIVDTDKLSDEDYHKIFKIN
ncbi:MAG: hypothetical protein A2163_00765 [Actinobacteria bacterium RBG_13_35_12]|nr:MAG: hypothetical protein A2163_00765 [Actinobacteria bacterium RBG_13_35_12]